MDSLVAASKVSRMWKKIGRALELRALDLSARDNGDEHMLSKEACHVALLAEAAYSRATGEDDAVFFKDLL